MSALLPLRSASSTREHDPLWEDATLALASRQLIGRVCRAERRKASTEGLKRESGGREASQNRKSRLRSVELRYRDLLNPTIADEYQYE